MIERTEGNQNIISEEITMRMQNASPEERAQMGRIIALSEQMSQMNGDLIPAINKAGGEKDSGIVVFKRQK